MTLWNSYSGFPEDVAAALAAKNAVERFAAAQTDATALCPRCGRETMKERLLSNALSRCAEVYICDECGIDEAIREWKDCPLPLSSWAIAAKAPSRRLQRPSSGFLRLEVYN